MGGNSNGHEQSSTQTVNLLGFGEITQDGWNLNGNGSNALILAGKKRSKTTAKNKVSRKNKAMESSVLSKRKKRKLQMLQEEKEKKLVLFKSIKLLQKHKIMDDACSFLQSSGTIGQAETFREKRRLAVQFSKAGLKVPDEISVFKNKEKNSSESDVIRPGDQGKPVVCSIKGSSSVILIEKDEHSGLNRKKSIKKADYDGSFHAKDINKVASLAKPVMIAAGSQQQSLQTNSEIAIKSLMNVNNESDMLCSSLDCATNACYDEGVKSSTLTSLITDNQNDTAGLHAPGVDDCNINAGKLESLKHHAAVNHISSAIVVHVSRPHEVQVKRKELPIIMMEQEIMEAINEHPILVLCGETGCGKTTQVPQFLYEAGYGSRNHADRRGIIGITQPRRVAVLATAKRVSYELGLQLGREVGFQVRHDKMIGNDCSIKFMTDGILLREAQSDFLLKRYSAIILDEAHERSLNTDILIGMLSRIIKIRHELYEDQHKKMLSGIKISADHLVTRLKLVLMSATLRVEDFVSNKRLFEVTPPVLEVPVRQYPVTIHFSRKTRENYLEQAYKKVLSIHKRLPPGGILVFATGQREVEFLCKKLRKASQKFSENGVKKIEDEAPAGFESVMKDIDEAFAMEGDDFPEHRIDRFCSDEDDDFEEIDEGSLESETDSELLEDGENGRFVESGEQEGNGFVLDFLENPESISSLKVAFESLAGTALNESSKEKLDLHLASSAVGPMYVLPLYAMLPASAQLHVFDEVPGGKRLIIVATNVAETSLTIPGIKYVVDTGKEKAKNYNHGNGMAIFEIQWISKASAAQRAGRAGRTGPGHCYRLYSSAAFGKDDIFPEFSCPEISKIPVDGVVLLMKFMGIDKVENFPFPTPPKPLAVEEALHCLKAIGALDEKGSLTLIGRSMAQYPMSPRHSRMILTVIEISKNRAGSARLNLVLGYAVAIAASLSFPDPFLMEHVESRETTKNSINRGMNDADEKVRKKMKSISKASRARFRNLSSDAFTTAFALQLFELAENSFDFCKSNSLHLKTMEEMSKLRRQILRLIFHNHKPHHDVSWNHGSFEDVEAAWQTHSDKHPLWMNEEELLAQAICAGWADRVAKRMRAASGSSEKANKSNSLRYQSCAADDAVFLHRRSSVSSTVPEFAVYNELLCTNRPYMHGVTAVKPEWLVRYANSMCCFSAPLTDPKPFYEPLSDNSYCWVNPIFGRHNWQLPLHSLPIKDESLRISVFGCALLEGNVLPCLKRAKDFLAANPSSLLRPEALGQRRVSYLLNGLKIGSRSIDNRAKLKEAWHKNCMFLYAELLNWFQERFHGQFEKLWEQLLEESKLEGFELFPKKAKKNRKIASGNLFF